MSRKRCRKIKSKRRRAWMTKSKKFRQIAVIPELVWDHP
jgi:hypothetical protein